MPRKNNLVAAAIWASALASACRRAPEPAASPAVGLPDRAVSLTAPDSTLFRPISVAATAYTNEQQAESLRAEAQRMGIADLRKPGTASDEDARPPITYEEGIERTREYAKAFAAQRRAIDKARPKSVALPGTTPGILPTPAQGAPVATDSASE